MKPWIPIALLALVLAGCGSSSTPADPTTSAEPGVTEPEPEPEPLQVLIRPEPGASLDEILADVADAGAVVVRHVRGTPFYLVRLPAGSDVEDFIRRLGDDKRVVVVERDRLLAAPEGGGATLPVGGEFFSFTEIANQPALQTMGAAIAHARATGAGVRIAVIDSGVVAEHLSLAGHVEPGGWDFVEGDPDPTDVRNGIDDDGDGWVDEGFGHGTFVSSLILAVAPDATILPYRVLDSDSNGLASTLAEAIVQAADAGVHAINLSLGMEHHVHVVGEAIKYARSNGVIVIASAGNTGNEEVTYPATLAFAFSITAVDPADVLAPFASYGEDVDLSAPGDTLLGAYPAGPDTAAHWSGTSFSAALASGAFALVREMLPGQSPQVVVDRLQSTTVDVTGLNPGFEGKIGTGRLDVDAATQSP